MGISRDSKHKKRETGGTRAHARKKRKFEMGRVAANTKLGAKDIRPVRGRGGNMKWRALRNDSGNFSWGSECYSKKSRILDVVYNATNNELLRTKTLVKNCIVEIDAVPFRQWYEAHYGVDLKRKGNQEKDHTDDVKQSSKVQRKLAQRQKGRVIDPKLEDQFARGRLLACISSRPGQTGRCDGYILEGKEYDFYKRKMDIKKGGKAAKEAQK